jgi:predicted nucleic acid-binding protein
MSKQRGFSAKGLGAAPLSFLRIIVSTGMKSMNDKVFLDTNLWIYLHSQDEKSKVVQQLIERQFASIVISTQVLSETYHVLTRKGITDKKSAEEIINDLNASFQVAVIDTSIISQAISLNIRHNYSFWDSLIVASAIQSGCSILYSEDMAHGQTIEKSLRIVNPFF